MPLPRPRFPLFLLLAAAALTSASGVQADTRQHPVGWDRIVRPALPTVREVNGAFYVPKALGVIPTLDGEFTVSDDAAVDIHSGGASNSPFGAATPNAVQIAGPNVRINDTSLDPAGTTNSETSITANGPKLIAGWNDGKNFGTSPGASGWGYSSDGGATWTDGGVLPVPNTLALHEGDPSVTNDFAGNFYYADLYTPGGGISAIAVCKGAFSGPSFSWNMPVIVNSSLTDFLDKEWIAADKLSGKLYLTYTRFLAAGGDEIDFQSSSDQGATWSAPIVLTNSALESVQGSRVVVGPGGFIQTIYFVYDNASQNNYMRARRSTDGGLTFGPEITLPTGPSGILSNYGSGPAGFNRARGIGFPSLAVDFTGGANSGRVYSTWEETVNYYYDPLGTLGNFSEVESNGSPGTANAISIGQAVRGNLASTADQDWFSFNGVGGQTVTLYLVPDVSSNEDGFIRVYAGGGAVANRAELSYIAKGTGLCVFTPPSNGTYFFRILANSANLGNYVVYTGIHLPPPPGDQVGRDQRDAVLSSSADGVTWTARTVVNDDAPLYDNTFPEVAADALGQVSVDWYDHRRDAANGITTDIFDTQSSNGGVTFIPSSIANDGPAINWNNVSSNLAPNMGDYSALVADGCSVYANFADGRQGSPDSWLATLDDCATPTLVSLVQAVAQPDHVDLVWYSADRSATAATVYRSEDANNWTALGDIVADGNGQLQFRDNVVVPGANYSYRLGVPGANNSIEYLGQTWVSIPAESRMAMRTQVASGGVTVSFILPRGEAGTLELFDVGGRSVESLRVSQSGQATMGHQLRTGIYLVKLSQGARSMTNKAVVVR